MFDGPRAPEAETDGGADEELIDVDGDGELFPDLGETPAERRREPRADRRLEKLGQALGPVRIGVVAEKDPAHFAPNCPKGLAAGTRSGGESKGVMNIVGPVAENRREGIGNLRKLEPCHGSCLGLGVARRLDDHQGVTGRHLLSRPDEHLGDDSPHGGREGDLHLHRLEDADRLPGRYRVADLRVDRDNHGGRACAHLAGPMEAEAVDGAFDLDPDPAAHVIEKPQSPVAQLQAGEVFSLFAKSGLDDAPVKVHAVAPVAGGHDLKTVGFAAEREVDLLTGRGWHSLRRKVRRVGVEIGPRDAPVGLIGEDRGGDERLERVLLRHPAGGDEAVEPGRIDPAARELLGSEDLDQKRLVGGSPLDDEVEIAEGGEHSCTRLVPISPGGDQLGDQRVEVAWNDTAARDPSVEARAGAEGRVEAGDGAGRGEESCVGILGADPNFDRRALLLDGDLRNRLSARDPDLDLDEVEPGDLLGDAMLDLKPRVHLEEVVLVAADEELRRADSRVTDFERRGLGRSPELLVETLDEGRRWRFLDDLLAPPLDGAVAGSDGTHGAVYIGGYLYLDVTPPRNLLFQKQTVVAKRAFRFRGGGPEGFFEARGIVDHADAPPPAARARLDGDWESELASNSEAALGIGHRPSAPGYYGYADTLGELLR